MPDSIKEFLSKLNKLHYSLTVENNNLVLKGDKRKLSNNERESIKNNVEVVSFIKNNKQKIIEYLSEEPLAKKSTKVKSINKLSGLQLGMLFHSLLDKKSGAHIIQFSCEVYNLNKEYFAISCHTL